VGGSSESPCDLWGGSVDWLEGGVDVTGWGFTLALKVLGPGVWLVSKCESGLGMILIGGVVFFLRAYLITMGFFYITYLANGKVWITVRNRDTAMACRLSGPRVKS